MKNKEAKSIFSSLENFSSTPPPQLWDNIEAQLDKPKKKKRPVVWWWVAAGLVAGLSLTTILNVNSNKNNSLELNNTNEVVLQNNSNDDSEIKVVKNNNATENGEKGSSSSAISIINENNTNAVVLQNNSNQDIENKKEKNNNAAENGIVGSKSTKSDVVNGINTNRVVLQNILNHDVATKKERNNNAAENGIVESKKTKPNVVDRVNNKNLTTQKGFFSYTNDTSVTATVTAAKNNSKFAGSNKKAHNGSNAAVGNDSQSNALAINNKTSSSKETNNSYPNNNSGQNKGKAGRIGTATVAVAEVKQNKENVANTNFKATVANDKNTISEINSNKTIAANSKVDDSVKIKKEMAQLNALAELEKDKTTKKKTSEVIDKWSLEVFAGVMSSDNFTNDKALGNTVASKQSSGYGVKTNYKLNKKWAVSSGFKINELGQKIAGVSYYERSALSNPTMGSIPLENFDTSQDSPSKNNTIVLASSNDNFLFATNSKAASGFETGNVTQNLKYFEMPIEVSYAVLSKKKTSIIMNTGGFVGKLISNEMLLDGSSIGENNNVKEYVYGTLLSSTLQYEFYKKTKFFIEPGMNYYVNPLENQSFNQFQWVFNVGINVSF